MIKIISIALALLLFNSCAKRRNRNETKVKSLIWIGCKNGLFRYVSRRIDLVV